MGGLCLCNLWRNVWGPHTGHRGAVGEASLDATQLSRVGHGFEESQVGILPGEPFRPSPRCACSRRDSASLRRQAFRAPRVGCDLRECPCSSSKTHVWAEITPGAAGPAAGRWLPPGAGRDLSEGRVKPVHFGVHGKAELPRDLPVTVID